MNALTHGFGCMCTSAPSGYIPNGELASLVAQMVKNLPAIKKQFLLLEKEIQEEYDRKMVALTAECDLETRKKTESQYQREMAAMEEAEEVLKRVSERVRQL